MNSTLFSYSFLGLEAVPVSMEVKISRGMPIFSIIGMAGASVKESRDRVRAALEQSGFDFPMVRKIINLAPAELHKTGSHFDLAMAIGILLATGQIQKIPENSMFCGELGLGGGVRPVRGILPAMLMAQKHGIKNVILPYANCNEASLLENLNVYGVASLREALDLCVKPLPAKSYTPSETNPVRACAAMDFAHVRGHKSAKRALQVAAAGGHHLLMSGPPGSGKSMLAQCFPSILPPLDIAQKLEVMSIYSLAGERLSLKNEGFCGENSDARPVFRRVHNSCSPMGLLGGGSQLYPGELTLAHHGVLFMDEFPEFDRSTLELLRLPMEEGVVNLRRGANSVSYPARFQLIAAKNPCPCGYFGDPNRTCSCPPYRLRSYVEKLSGPLLERIDMHIHVPRLEVEEWGEIQSNGSKEMKERVLLAREMQSKRWGKHGFSLNRDMPATLLRLEEIDEEGEKLIKFSIKHYKFSGRILHSCLRLARSIADLEGKDKIATSHLAEALQYRMQKGNLP